MPAHDSVSEGQFKDFYHSRFATARVSPSGYLSNMATHYDHRGQGHGSALLGEITADADKLGKPLTLHAREDLHPWYGRHGFEPSGAEDPLMGLPAMVRQPKRARPE